MPVTFVTFGLGYLAIIGIPPFAGFFSKDPIIETAFGRRRKGLLFGGAALLGAGHHRVLHDPRDADDVLRDREALAETHPHESPAVMGWPMVVLAVGRSAPVRCWPSAAPIGSTGSNRRRQPRARARGARWMMTVGRSGGRRVGVASPTGCTPATTSREAPPQDVRCSRSPPADLYGDAFNEAVFMRPWPAAHPNLVVVDDVAVDGRYPRLAHLVGRSPTARAWQNRVRPVVCAVDVGRSGPGDSPPFSR